MSNSLFPLVRWAQNEDNIFLKVELHNVEEPDVVIKEKRVAFQAVAEGSKGRNLYSFEIDVFGSINEKESRYNIEQSCVRLTLRKSHRNLDKTKQERFWNRLLLDKNEKLPWLKIDFEKFCDADDSGSEDGFKKKLSNFDMEAFERQQAEQMLNGMDFEGDNFSIPNLNLTKYYLITYNSIMLIGFLLIVINLIKGYHAENTDFFPKVWTEISGKMFCCQLAQFLEIAHALLGYVKSSASTTSIQVFGRGFVLFVILSGEERMHDKPFVFYLFLVWSLIEIIRYPYYLLSVLKYDIGIITYLRYTAWIILYPLGFLCEGVIILRAMPYFEQTQKYSYQLPTKVNMSFDFPSVLKIYLLFVFLPGIIFLMSHMRQLRLKKLGKQKLN